MKNTAVTFLRACSLSVALAGSVALVAGISLPDQAFADNGKGNGGGNGNGNGNGGGNGAKAEKSSGNSGAAKGGKETTKATKKTTKKTTAKKTSAKKAEKAPLDDDLGVSASELGALNAAHASPNALKNASPNSRVGRIAAYKDSVLAGEELEADLAEKLAELEGLSEPTRTLEEIQADLLIADADVATKADLVEQLEADLEAAGGVDPTIEGLLADARLALSDAETVQGGIEDEEANAIAYETVSGEVADLEEQLEDQPELERSLLEAAANKPVTDEVEAAVKQLLGL
jgi:hypothetical protein